MSSNKGKIVSCLLITILVALPVGGRDLSGEKFSPVRAVSDPTISEGVATIGADLVHADGYFGEGVKVAVIDSSFDISNPEIAGNLVEVKSFREDGLIWDPEDMHGTNCAEIVVDVAPKAELYLYTETDTDEFIEILDYAINKGIQIISCSLSFPGGPFDGTHERDLKVNEARAQGILYCQSAGNFANKHWEGGFVDENDNGWHEFSTQDETIGFDASEGQSIKIWLCWDDWPTSNIDYDLYLYRGKERVSESTRRQTGDRSPQEWIKIAAPFNGTYHISIKKYSATENAHLELYMSTTRFNENQVAVSSLSIPGCAKGSLTVGATHHATDEIMAYSSRGPTNDGRIKPDVTAPTGVATSNGQFGGTSAATPHVAGAAALLWGVDPELTCERVVDLLEETAVDLGPSGRDNTYGSGRINVYQAYIEIAPLKPTPSISIPSKSGTPVTAWLLVLLPLMVGGAVVYLNRRKGGKTPPTPPSTLPEEVPGRPPPTLPEEIP